MVPHLSVDVEIGLRTGSFHETPLLLQRLRATHFDSLQGLNVSWYCAAGTEKQTRKGTTLQIFSTTFIRGYFRSESKDRERKVALLF